MKHKNRYCLPDKALIPFFQRWMGGLLSCLICCFLSFGYTPVLAQSVLRQGTWVKIGVTESGVYRLSQAQLVQLNPGFATADPRQLRLYGNGGAVLPQANAVTRPGDLTENAIQVVGEADGRFDAGDAVVFFGQSPRVVRYDSTRHRFTHQINLYADTTFYFLTIGNAAGLRIADRPAGSPATTPVVTTFTDYQFHELDALKLPKVHSGREWFGEYLTNDTTTIIPFEVPGILPNSTVRLRASVMAGYTVSTQFRVQVNNQLAGLIPVDAISGYEYDSLGIARTDTFATKLPSADSLLRVAVTFQKFGNYLAQGYLNYVGLQTQRELRQYDKPVWVRRLAQGQYAVKQATTDLRVWDITDPLRPVGQAYTLSAGREAAWASARSADYFLFTDARTLTPVSLAGVPNQDLHSQLTPDLLIITPAAWKSQADRLAAFRRAHDQLSVLVVTNQQVYNEFGSGQPDPTAIRDMVRYFFQKQPGKLRYLLLFGDATYDYRNIAGQVSAAQLANMVPVYESRASLHPVLSYSSDDYFGFMDTDEGEWPEDVKIGSDTIRMDIGVGRLPVKSADEAQTVVDKLIRYSSDASISGDWQTRVTLIADNGDYDIHQQDADQMARLVEKTAPAYRAERLFIDDYPLVNTAIGQKSPIVNQLINQAVADGRLIINYSGHGGESTLADEQIVTLQDILSWKNARLPLFVTATCQFGRYDEPDIVSGAELTLLSRTGGGIGLITTTRPVYANTNLLVNTAFYKAVFAPVNGQLPRMGDVMRATKNNSLSGPVNRNFALLGDPSMRLAYPKAQAVLTQVNSKTVTQTSTDTLRALQSVELKGEIRLQSQRLADFAGVLQVSLYDKATAHTTLGGSAESPKMTYQAFSNPIFTGEVTVQQGQFTVRFTMPKDIDYAVGKGKLFLYAIRADSLQDATGSYDSLRIGGSVFADSIDTQPPVVVLSVAGGTVSENVVHVTGPDVTLRVDLSDNRGINIARSGLGHDLTAWFGTQPAVILNENYVANGASGRQGTARYTFRQVSPGTYTIRVKAWDINNNSSEGALSIIVSERPGLALRTVKASPNPVSEQTILTAELNRSGEPLDWTVGIYDLNSRLLNQQTGQCSNCESTVAIGAWNGQTSTGQPLASGLYIIQVKIRSAVDGSVATGTGRLVLAK